MKLHPGFLVYVAAPFSPTEAQKARVASVDEPDFAPLDAVQENKAAASALGLEVAALGCMPIVPHTAHGGRPELESVQDYLFWIKATAALLLRCDAALFSSNWEESGGARGEHALCLEKGIPIFYSVDDLRLWLDGTEILEDEALLSLCMRLGDELQALETERPIPFRLASEVPLCGALPSPSKSQAVPSDFGVLEVPRAPNLPAFSADEGGLDDA